MSENNASDILQVQGINSKGFGTIPKLIMQDRRLTPQAKAIYGYFCSYAGVGRTAFPRLDKIIADMVMSRNAYYKHFSLLKEFGYIKVDQEKSKAGHFARNIYTIMQIVPCTKIGDTVNSHAPKDIEPNHAQPCTKIRDAVKRDTVKRDTNINSLKNNSSKINRERESAPALKEYGEFQQVRMTEIIHDGFVELFGYEKATEYINRLDRHIASTGKRYKDHYATIRKWIAEDDSKQQSRQSKPNRVANCPQHKRDYAELERMEQQLLTEGS